MATDRADTDVEMVPLELGFLPPLLPRRVGIVRESPFSDVVSDGFAVNSKLGRYFLLGSVADKFSCKIRAKGPSQLLLYGLSLACHGYRCLLALDNPALPWSEIFISSKELVLSRLSRHRAEYYHS